MSKLKLVVPVFFGIIIVFYLGWILSKVVMQKGKAEMKTRAIVIGMDGLDPKLLKKYREQKLLPNFSTLHFSELQTVNPPQSPVAWSSFITGANPGRHGIYDFLRRDAHTYMPDFSMAKVIPSEKKLKLGNIRIPISNPQIISYRKGTPFWQVVSKAGLHISIIRCPVTFPPEEVNGELLAGLGVPDLRGTQGTFSFYTTEQIKGSDLGGDVHQVLLNGNRFESFITGPINDLVEEKNNIRIKLDVRIEPHKDKAIIIIQDNVIHMKEGEWSDWIKIKFGFNIFASANGLVKFYLKSLSPIFKLYVSPIQIDPTNPALPISYPADFAKRIKKAIGYFHTIGMPEETWSTNEGRLDEDEFLKMAYDVLEEREKMLDIMLEKKEWALLVFVIDTPDRIQHMFWQGLDRGHPIYNEKIAAKASDVILKLYQRMDNIIGKILKYMDSNTTLIVLSDHGFSSFRRAVQINYWLKERGYLVFSEYSPEGNELFRGVDWSKSKAYSYGLNSIYLNMKNREDEGIVPWEEKMELENKIIAGLDNLTDPVNGNRIFRKVYRATDIYQGPHKDDMPDIILGYNEGYRSSWQTALGATPALLIEDNRKKWSGDHCVDASLVPGLLLSNREIKLQEPTIMDIGPTVLSLFRLQYPEGMEGTSFLGN